jgi:hypothetical protein
MARSLQSRYSPSIKQGLPESGVSYASMLQAPAVALYLFEFQCIGIQRGIARPRRCLAQPLAGTQPMAGNHTTGLREHPM